VPDRFLGILRHQCFEFRRKIAKIRTLRFVAFRKVPTMTKQGPSLPGGTSWNSIATNATKALALCRGGAIHDGIELYKQVLKAEYDLRKNLPVALHLTILLN
jgi:hypothetical protein